MMKIKEKYKKNAQKIDKGKEKKRRRKKKEEKESDERKPQPQQQQQQQQQQQLQQQAKDKPHYRFVFRQACLQHCNPEFAWFFGGQARG